MTCRFCKETGNHYIGGGQWVCFRHFLACFGLAAASTTKGTTDGK